MNKGTRDYSIEELKKIASKIRVDIVKMTAAAGSGHPGGSLSSAEIFAALYFKVLKHDPLNPKWQDRDRFVLSKGHACPGLYAALAESGYFPKNELLTLRKIGSRLQGHPDMKRLPGIEISTGSLGQGLSVASGMALGFRIDKRPNRVYCLMGDGETQEGQIWEAALTAAHYKLDNLCGIVDVNNLQIDGCTDDVKCLKPYKEKWQAFGWAATEINGNNVKEIIDAFQKAQEIKNMPYVIIAHTIKGKGVSFMENKAEWHGKAPSQEQEKAALGELEKQ
ncbi:transketolase [Candidatus Woesearchaeota archaeon]|nr:transketolase [Candidatus Woesearchaeota archaeon]